MAEDDQAKSGSQQHTDYAKGFGEYLARLLAASTLSNDQKEAWAVLVPEMSLDQMLRLTAVLERYIDPAVLPEIVELRAKIQAADEAYTAKIQAINNKAQADLKAVMAEANA